MPQFIIACGLAGLAGMLGAVIGPQLVAQPGMGGLFAGVGLGVGFLAFWRGIGGTWQDIKDLFR